MAIHQKRRGYDPLSSPTLSVGVGVGVAVVVAVGVGVGVGVVVAMTDLTIHWRKLYENNFLGAWDLYDDKKSQYRELNAVVDHVSNEEVTMQGGRKSRPFLLHLVSKATGRKFPPMILSKSHGTTMQIMFGEKPSGWTGKEITVYVRKNTRVMAGTGDVLTIRNRKSGQQLKDELRSKEREQIPDEEFSTPETSNERQPGED